ncbi:MAG: type II toxin-antitoxin system VapC family toxin [Polyangiaceae bacterium]
MTTYVLDASVAVAAVRPCEPSHAPARARLARLLTGADDIVVPALFDVEVTSALVRGQALPARAEKYLRVDLAGRKLVTIGPRSARAICGVVAKTQLRAADAAYVWVALTHGLPLVTLDDEVGRKVAGICRVEPP